MFWIRYHTYCIYNNYRYVFSFSSCPLFSIHLEAFWRWKLLFYYYERIKYGEFLFFHNIFKTRWWIFPFFFLSLSLFFFSPFCVFGSKYKKKQKPMRYWLSPQCMYVCTSSTSSGLSRLSHYVVRSSAICFLIHHVQVSCRSESWRSTHNAPPPSLFTCPPAHPHARSILNPLATPPRLQSDKKRIHLRVTCSKHFSGLFSNYSIHFSVHRKIFSTRNLSSHLVDYGRFQSNWRPSRREYKLQFNLSVHVSTVRLFFLFCFCFLFLSFRWGRHAKWLNHFHRRKQLFIKTSTSIVLLF